MNVKLSFSEDIKEYAMATKRIAELTLEFLKHRYDYVVEEIEIEFLKTGNFNFYARPGKVIIEYYDGAFDREPKYCNGIGEKYPSSPYLIAHEVCHNAFGFCTYEGLAETLSTIVCRELGDIFRKIWPTGIKVKEYAEYRHRTITSINYSDIRYKGLHFSGTYMFFCTLEKKIGSSNMGRILRSVCERWGEISQADFIREARRTHPETYRLLEIYGDTLMYPLVFWKHSKGWLRWRLDLFKKALENNTINEAIQVIRSKMYKLLEYVRSVGSLTENIVNWLQALEYHFILQYYDGRRAELKTEKCPPSVKRVIPKNTTICSICRGIFNFSSCGMEVKLRKLDDYCVILIKLQSSNELKVALK